MQQTHRAAHRAFSVFLAFVLVLTCNGATAQPLVALAANGNDAAPASPVVLGSENGGADDSVKDAVVLEEGVEGATEDGAQKTAGADSDTTTLGGMDVVADVPAFDEGADMYGTRDLTHDKKALTIDFAGLVYDDAAGVENLVEADAEGRVDAADIDPLLLSAAELRFKATVQPDVVGTGDTFALTVPQDWCALPTAEQLARANEALSAQATLAIADGRLVVTLTEAAAEATEPFELVLSYPLTLAGGVLKDKPVAVELLLPDAVAAVIVLPAKPQAEAPTAEGSEASIFVMPQHLGAPLSSGTDFTNDRDQLDLGLVTFSYKDAAGKKHEVPTVDGADGKKHLDFSDVPFASIGKMSMEVDFQILLNDATRAVKQGDYYAYQLPHIFKIDDNPNPQNIVASTGDVLGSFTIENGEIHVVFSDAVDIDQGNMSIVGGVACEFDLNGDALSSSDPTDEEWTLQTGGTTYVFHAPKTSTDLAGIKKTGVFNKDDSTVIWTIAVGTDSASAGAPLKGITVADAYDKTKQKGVVVRDAQGATLSVTETDAGFSYTFPNDSTAVAPYELTVTANVAPDVLRAATNGQQMLSNEAVMSAPVGSSVTVTGDPRATGSVTVPPYGLSKQGTPLNSSTIAWELVVNEGGTGSAQNVVVYDRLDPRAAYTGGTLKVNGASVDVNPGSIPSDKTYALIASDPNHPGTTLMEIHFVGIVSSEQRITFDTSIVLPEDEHDVDINFPNEAWMTYDWPSGEGPVPGAREPLNIRTKFQVVYLDKETPRYNSATGVIDWTVKPSTRTDNYTSGVITDNIPSDQKLVDGSVAVKYKGVPLSAGELTAVFAYAEPRLTFTFDKEKYALNDIEISFQTQALNFQNENMVNHTYENAAHIDVYQDSDLKFQADDKAERTFENRFLAKTSDYSVVDDPNSGSTGYVHYRIVLNENQMPSKNLKLEDDLGVLTTQVVDASGAQIDTIDADKWNIATDSAHAIKVTKTEGVSVPVDVTDAAQVAKWITDKKIFASFGETSACYTVDLWLTLDKTELLRLQKEHDGSFSLRPVNKATASSESFNGGTPVDVTCTGAADSDDIDNRLVAKSADGSHQGEGYLDYRVNINPNGSNLVAPELVDKPDLSLDIDLDSVKLYRAQHEAGGAIAEAVGDEVDASAWSKELAYDAGSDRAVLKVKLPAGSASYVLKYRARVVSAPAGGTVTNDVALTSGDGQKGSDRCEAEVDSSSWGWLTKKAVYKFVKADEFGEKATPIAGIIFNLYEDAACTTLVKTSVSNAQGIVAFYGLDLNTTYYYKEDAASVPGSYQALVFNEATCQFTTGGAGSNTVASAAVKNKRTTSDAPVEIVKTFADAGSLNPQSTFKLYLYPNGFGGAKKVVMKTALQPDGTYAFSADGSGAETFANKAEGGTIAISGLPWGDYALEEVNPARGYAAYEGMKCFSVVAPAQDDDVWRVDYAPTGAPDVIGAEKKVANAKTAISVEKSTPMGNDLSGAVLRIYEDNSGAKGALVKDPFRSDGPFEYTASSGSSFTWNINGLPTGTYWLSEDTPPTDSDVGKFQDVKFEVDKFGKLSVLSGGGSAEGQAIKVADLANAVRVKKLDQWGKGVAGATLQLRKFNGATWDNVSGATWTPVTAADAEAGHDFGGLERGATYRVVETTVPTGYAPASHPAAGTQQMIEFTVDEFGKVTAPNLHNGEAPSNGSNGVFRNSQSGNSFTIRNERIVGHAEFVKYDTTQVNGMNKTLAGVEFDLYLKDSAGDTLVNTGHFKSDASGKVTTQGSALTFANDLGTAKAGEPISRGLPEGKYYFKEVATHDDFVFDAANPLVTAEFTVSDTTGRFTWKSGSSFGDVTTVTMPDGSLVTNEPLNASVLLLKMARSALQHEIIGATFVLREKGTENVVDCQTTNYGNHVFTNTDSNGNVHTAKDPHDGSLVFVNVPAGEYEVVETVPAPGYQIDSPQIIADVIVSQTQANKQYLVNEVNSTSGWITNEPNKFSVEKTGENGQSVAGTKFELAGINGATFAKTGAGSITWEVGIDSSNNPYEIAGELVADKVYKLTETAPAPGYQTAADVYVKMTATGELQKSASASGLWEAVGSDNKLSVKNDPNELSIAKKDQFGNPVSGATLQLSGEFANATSPLEWTTDGKPKDITGKLVAGKEYVIHESVTPDGYLSAADQVIRMTAEGQLEVKNATGAWNRVPGNALVFHNERALAHAKIVKTEGADKKPFTGATFNLYKKGTVAGSADLLVLADIAPTGSTEASWTTSDVDESVINPDTNQPLNKGLATGAYYFVETATDDGHHLAGTHYGFVVSVAPGGMAVAPVAPIAVNNDAMNASMSLLKVDADDGTTPIAGTTFKLAYTPAGGGAPMTTTLTTAADGTVKAEGLGKGSYTLTETGTDVNYVNGGFRATFTVTDACQDNSLVIGSDAVNKAPYNLTIVADEAHLLGAALANERVLGAANVEKQDAAGIALAGVTFEVRKQSDDMRVGEPATTDAAGKATFANLPWGEYYLVETAVPAGYVLDSTHRTFSIGYGALVKNFTVAGDGAIVNTQNEFTLAKYAEDKMTGLSGALFEITGTFAGGTGTETRSLLAGAQSETWTGKLVGGNTYTLHEKVPPAGYKTVPDFAVVMGADGTLSFNGAHEGVEIVGAAVKVSDPKNEAAIAKLNEGGANLAGAQFKLKALNGGAFADGSVERSWVSGAVDEVLKDLLVAGVEYELIETAPAPGYTLPAMLPVTLRMTAEGQLECLAGSSWTEVSNNRFTVTDVKNQLSLSKQDASGTALAGAVFTIKGDLTNADGTVTAQTIPLLNTESDRSQNVGEVTGRLVAGKTYTVHEVMPPDGYVSVADFDITMNDDGTIKAAGALPAGVTIDAAAALIMVKDAQNKVRIAKTDEAGAYLAGAQFKLTGTFADGTSERTWTSLSATPTEGAGLFTGKLIANNEYVLTETAPAPGYVISAFTGSYPQAHPATGESLTLKLDDVGGLFYRIAAGEGAWKPLADNAVAIKDAPTQIKIAKTDESGAYLTGAQFKLTGTFADGSSELAWTSLGAAPAEGAGQFTGKLVAGHEYELAETVPPDGYKRTAELSWMVRVTPDGEMQYKDAAGTDWKPAANGVVVIQNEPLVFSFDKVELYTESCSDPVLGAADPVATRPLEGAEFTLFTDETCAQRATLADGSPAIATSGSDGAVRFDHVVAGAYFVRETVVPVGHVANQVVYSLEVNDDGTIVRFAPKDTAEGVLDHVVNDVHRADIRIKKVAETDESKALPGSTYGLYKRAESQAGELQVRALSRIRVLDASAQLEPDLQLIAKATTDEMGFITFKGVLMDTDYVIRELVAPDGSLVSEKPISIAFSVGDDGVAKIERFDDGSGTAEIDENGSIVWKEPQVVVSFGKTDPSGKLLAGAKLHVEDKNGAVVGEPWTSSAEAEHVIEGVLTAGETYRLVEDEAPAGYLKAEDVEFTVENPVLGPDEQFVQHVIMVDQPAPLAPEQPTGKKDPSALVRTGDPWAQAMLALGGIAAIGMCAAGASTLARRRKNMS